MEQFFYEEPSMARKNEAISYINEFYEYNSKVNGSGGLDRYLDNYEGWLEKLKEDLITIPSEERVPGKTYFLVRANDNKIVGMINIRLTLNKKLEEHGGHIGYSIRPTERRKGYNKINLYLGLKECYKYGIEVAKLDADIDNPASWKTMEALGGKRQREFYDDFSNCTIVDYSINVLESLEKNKEEYEPKIYKLK